MRVLTGIVIFFLFLLGLAVYMESTIIRQGKELLTALNHLHSHVIKADYEAIEEQLKEIDRLWVETRKLWVLIIDHQELDEFELSLAKTKSYLVNRAYLFAQVEIAQMKQIINQIPDKQILSLENIL